MATCAYCKTQKTELQEYGLPVCRDCFDIVKPNLDCITGICSILIQDLIDATGKLAAAPASPELVAAREDMERALRRLEDYLSRGIVPEDLKRSG